MLLGEFMPANSGGGGVQLIGLTGFYTSVTSSSLRTVLWGGMRIWGDAGLGCSIRIIRLRYDCDISGRGFAFSKSGTRNSDGNKKAVCLERCFRAVMRIMERMQVSVTRIRIIHLRIRMRISGRRFTF